MDNMNNLKPIMDLLMEAVQSTDNREEDGFSIPVGVSNRHIHLSQEDLNKLFGEGYELNRIKELSQPGQYACKEVVTICGPKGAIENVRVLGPVRNSTQVEVLKGDLFKLGVSAPVRMSGVLEGTPGICIVGPKGSVHIKEGLILAQRHIHMTLEDAERLGVSDGDIISIEVLGLRGGIYNNVAIRASGSGTLECHIDIEEANAMDIDGSSKVKIIK